MRRRTGLTSADEKPQVAIKLDRRYILWWAFMPILTAISSFALLCALECTALPWFVLLLAPALTITLGLCAAIYYWKWSAKLEATDRAHIRNLIAWSALWGPFLGLMVISVLLTIVPSVLS